MSFRLSHAAAVAALILSACSSDDAASNDPAAPRRHPSGNQAGPGPPGQAAREHPRGRRRR